MNEWMKKHSCMIFLVSSLTPDEYCRHSNETSINKTVLHDRKKRLSLSLTGRNVNLTKKVVPCFPREMSMYWHSLGCVRVLRIWKRPRILMELGVRGSPLLPHTSWGSGEAKKVKAPSSASLRGCMVSLMFTTSAQGVYAAQGRRKITCKKKKKTQHFHHYQYI